MDKKEIEFKKKLILEGIEKFEGQLKREQPEAFCCWPKFCLICTHEVILDIYDYLPGDGFITKEIIKNKVGKELPNILFWNLIIIPHSIEDTKKYYPNIKPRAITFYGDD